MAFTKYSVEFDSEKTARSQGHELHVSPRHCVEICRELRGKSLAEAKSHLEGITRMKKAVPFKRHNSGVGHRAGLSGWDAGRFPQKAAKDILTILKSAEANAEYKGLDTDRMRIVHTVARTGRIIEGRMPRAMGRATAKNTATVTVEIVLKEFENGD
jgi:large subunit ribosomal protein L22